MPFPPMVMCLENLYLGLQDTKRAVLPESILTVFFENPSPNIYMYMCVYYIYILLRIKQNTYIINIILYNNIITY